MLLKAQTYSGCVRVTLLIVLSKLGIEVKAMRNPLEYIPKI
jgi:hypothetical protein